MKIREITLTNVRRFAGQTARITGIADGITTVSAPNESGKSTFFDALHALFFARHTSRTAEIKSLQPYAGGPVEIGAVIETPQGRFAVDKTFMASPRARITDLAAGSILAQGDEAEAWITAAIGADMAGPAGLLWVRQGDSGFGPEGGGQAERKERDRLREARQTLMSTVAGQIDSMTGGRRMDAIMKAAAADLDALATKNGKPKAHGEWAKAADLVSELTEELGRLAAQVDALGDALRRRAELTRLIEDPAAAEADAERAARIAELDQAIAAAQAHRGKVEAAERELRFAEQALSDVSGKIAERRRMADRRAGLAAERDTAALAIAPAEADLAEAEAGLLTATRAQAAAADTLNGARAAEARRQADQARTAAVKRRTEIQALLTRVSDLDRDLAAAREAQKTAPVDADTLAALEEMSRDLAHARSRREAGAVTVAMAYTASGRAVMDGAELPPDRHTPIFGPTSIDLPGLGTMTVTPPSSDDAGADVARSQAALDAALAPLGAADMAGARDMARSHAEATARATSARAALSALVPSGTDDLRRELADLTDLPGAPPAPETTDLPDVPSAEAAETAARQSAEDARHLRDAAASRLWQAGATLKLAQEALARADEDLSAQPDADLTASREDAQRTVEARRTELADLGPGDTDVQILMDDRDRLISVRRAAADAHASAVAERAQLNGAIRARADDGVEVRLEEVRGELDRAEARANRYASDARALALMIQALETARSAARDAYFEPVKRELIPLISMLHDGADVEMDPATMLPARIDRGGTAEAVEVLSGGATEQIAILTRLAFARLYARQGRQVPVILDDALVHADDDRIVRMFTALTRIARDQQIIVFSCRNRAFEDLGGHRPGIQVAPADQ